jgi:hypothetical protein
MIRVKLYEAQIEKTKVKKEIIAKVKDPRARLLKRISVMDQTFKNYLNKGEQGIINSGKSMEIDHDWYEEAKLTANKELIEELEALNKEDLVKKAEELGATVDAKDNKEIILSSIVDQKGVTIEVPKVEDYKEGL